MACQKLIPRFPFPNGAFGFAVKVPAPFICSVRPCGARMTFPRTSTVGRERTWTPAFCGTGVVVRVRHGCVRRKNDPAWRCGDATGDIPNSNQEPTAELPKCYQMLPSIGSISELRVATNSEENAKCVAEKQAEKMQKTTKCYHRADGGQGTARRRHPAFLFPKSRIR